MEALPRELVRAEQEAAELVRPRARGRSVDSALRRLLALGDALAVLIALTISLTVPRQEFVWRHIAWALAAVPLMLVLFKLYALYDRDVKRISYSTVDDIPRLFHAIVIGTLILWLFSKYAPFGRMSYAEVALFGGGTLTLVTCFRAFIRSLASRTIGPERALLVGRGKVADALVSKLAAHPEYRLQVVGCLTAEDPGQFGDFEEPPILGNLDELDQIATWHGVSRVIVATRDVDEGELSQLLRHCRTLSLKVSVLPKLSDVLGPAVEIDDVEGVTVLGLNPPWLPRSSRALKRVMDVLVAATLLIALSPVLLLVAIAIKLDSRGSVFFKQERVGRGGRRFRLFKFRSMVSDAEQRRIELLELSTDPHWLKLDYDPRITRLGRMLRRLSVDELPQLWNVLRGEMSMVGPRPLVPVEDELVEGWARGRLDLTPGITGYWQVLGRTRIPFEEMVKLDYLYVMNWSLWQDVKLMLKTLPVVLSGRGA